MPSNDRLGFDNNQSGSPIRPESRQTSPKKSISVLELRSLDGPLLNQELLTQSQILQDQVPVTTKEATKQKKERSENIHIGRLTLTPASSTMSSRELAIVRKSLEINKNGIFGRDNRVSSIENTLF